MGRIGSGEAGATDLIACLLLIFCLGTNLSILAPPWRSASRTTKPTDLQESITDAVVISLRQRLERERRRPGTSKKLLDLAAEVGGYPVLDDRTPDQIIGYDESGLPN
jgi:antitoxin VapB